MLIRQLSFLVALALSMAGCAPPSGQQVELTAPAYDNETQDFSVPPTKVIMIGTYEAPTPLRMDGAVTVTTPQLRNMMASEKPPVLIDVLGGNQTVSLPGAVWLPGADLGGAFDDALQPKFAARLAELTGGDKSRPIVFFCLSKTCWLSYSAGLRAVALGYIHVIWYRGGRNAWHAAGLPMEPVRRTAL